MTGMHNLPLEVKWCSKCLMSNQRPCSFPEHLHRPGRAGAKYLTIGDDGVCDACRFAERKAVAINWSARETELLRLLDLHRGKRKPYDCIVP